MKLATTFLSFSALLLSSGAFARTLYCDVVSNNGTKVLLSAGVQLDNKNMDSTGLAETKGMAQSDLTIDGVKGRLVLSLSAQWYDNYLGEGLSNIDDLFPSIDVAAFFYERVSPEAFATTYSKIAVRFWGTPTYSVFGGPSEKGTYRIWGVGEGASLNCMVRNL